MLRLFYAAEVLLGLEHMHKRCVVYRDLKVQNVIFWEKFHFSNILACKCSSRRERSCTHIRFGFGV
jgi:beta-adrenergic-receptor kinase